MKRFASSTAALGLVATMLLSGNSALADSTSNGSAVSILVDGKLMKSDVSSYMDTVHSRVMVPIRFVSEALGAQVVWDAAHNAVLINTPSFPAGISMQTNSIQIVVNGQVLQSDVAPVMENDHVIVPLRVIAEALQASVSWNQDSNSVQITSQNAIDASKVSTLNGFQAAVFARGTDAYSKPDDITLLGDHIFVTYQNGVGAKGEPTKTGVNYSTVVEYGRNGNVINSWNVTGKCDGLTADPANNRVLATVNEDGNSSMYIIQPDSTAGQQVQHITFNVDPTQLPGTNPLATGGGTDSIAIQNGNIYLTASAPQPDQNGNLTHTAIFQATIQGSTATLTPTFMDNATATDAVTGKSAALSLSDPDSSNTVPASVYQYGGDLVLDSQGDSELIFANQIGTSNQSLTRLSLPTQVDDVTWSTSNKGTLYVADNQNNKVFAITGNFDAGTGFVACPNDSTVAGLVGTVDLSSGTIHPFAMGIGNPKGLLFVPQNGN